MRVCFSSWCEVIWPGWERIPAERIQTFEQFWITEWCVLNGVLWEWKHERRYFHKYLFGNTHFVLTKHLRDNLIFYVVMKFEAGLAGKRICIPLLVLPFWFWFDWKLTFWRCYFYYFIERYWLDQYVEFTIAYKR